MSNVLVAYISELAVIAQVTFVELFQVLRSVTFPVIVAMLSKTLHQVHAIVPVITSAPVAPFATPVITKLVP